MAAAMAYRLLASNSSFEELNLLVCLLCLVLVFVTMLSRDQASSGSQSDSGTPEVVLRVKAHLQDGYRQNRVLLVFGEAGDAREDDQETETADVTVSHLKRVHVSELITNVRIVSGRDLHEMFNDSMFGSAAGLRRLEHGFHGSSAESLSVHDLFGLGRIRRDSSAVTLVLGSAGVGKSTAFCLQLPYEWASGRLMNSVELLLCVELRNERVLKARNTGELLQLVLDTNEEESRSLLHYARSKPGCMCIVMDGLDECDMSQCSMYMKRLMKGASSMPGTRIIITSRPCRAAFNLTRENDRLCCVEMIGFSETDVTEFVRRSLPEEKGEAMLEELKKNDDMAALMATPFMASLCCQQFIADGKISRCATSLFESMILRLLAQQANGVKADGYESIPKAQQSILAELSKFAFDRLMAKKLIFSENDVRAAQLSNRALQIGVLVACAASMLAMSARQFRFSHLMLQEHLAAYHAAKNLVKSAWDVAELVRSIGWRRGRTRSFWCFLMPFLPVQYFGVALSSLIAQSRKPGSEPQLRFTETGECRLCSLANSEMETLRSMMTGLLTTHDIRELANDLLRDAGGYEEVLRDVEQSGRDLSDSEILSDTLELWRKHVPTPSAFLLFMALFRVKKEVASHPDVMRAFESCQKIEAEPDGFSANDEEFEADTSTRLLAPTAASGYDRSHSILVGTFWSFVFEFLQYNKDIQPANTWLNVLADLGLTCDCLATPTMARMTHLVDSGVHRNLKTVLICERIRTNLSEKRRDCTKALLASIARCQCLEQLLVWIPLDEELLSMIAQVVSASCQILKIIRLDECEITPIQEPFPDGHKLINKITECSCLEVVGVSGRKLADACVHPLFQALDAGLLRNVTWLELDRCGLADDNFARLAQACSGRHQLINVCLFMNELTAASLPSLAVLLEHCPNLELVELRRNHFGHLPQSENDDAVLAGLASAIQACTRLRELLMFDSIPVQNQLYEFLQSIVQDGSFSLTVVCRDL